MFETIIALIHVIWRVMRCMDDRTNYASERLELLQTLPSPTIKPNCALKEAIGNVLNKKGGKR
jgi:hypothetical protein